MSPAYEEFDRGEERRLFLEGIALFNERRYHDAHDAWEEIWHNTAGQRAQFYRALNHAAVTLEHLARDNPRGVQRVFAMMVDRFDGLPAVFMGVDVVKFVEAMRSAVEPALGGFDEKRGAGEVIAPRRELPWDANRLPRIELVGD
jgi:hypothetical protein